MSNELKDPVGSPVPRQPLKPPVATGPGSGSPNRVKQPNKHDELRLLINSRHPPITVETPEEERLEALLLEVAMELGVPLFEWSVTSGLAKAHGSPMYNTDNPEQALSNIALIQGDGIFLLKDFARYCENDKICRRLRDLAENFSNRAAIDCAGGSDGAIATGSAGRCNAISAGSAGGGGFASGCETGVGGVES